MLIPSTWIHLFHHSLYPPLPPLWNSFNRYHFSFTYRNTQYLHYIHPLTQFPHILPLLLVKTLPWQDLLCPPVLWSCKRKKKYVCLYTPNTNTTILWKADHAKGRLYTSEGCKRKRLRRWMWMMYSLYENECRIFKLVEISIRREQRLKEEKWRKWTILSFCARDWTQGLVNVLYNWSTPQPTYWIQNLLEKSLRCNHYTMWSVDYNYTSFIYLSNFSSTISWKVSFISHLFITTNKCLTCFF
jgi:hypothetical protein